MQEIAFQSLRKSKISRTPLQISHTFSAPTHPPPLPKSDCRPLPSFPSLLLDNKITKQVILAGLGGKELF